MKVDDFKPQRIFVFPVWYGVIVLLQPYKDDVYLFSKERDEKAATLHFPALGAAVNVLAQVQADYIGFTGPGVISTSPLWDHMKKLKNNTLCGAARFVEELE